MYPLGISFLSWKYSPSIKYVLQVEVQVLTTDRRYLVIDTAETLSNMFCTVFTEQGSDKENMIIDDGRMGRGETFCIAPGNFERLKLPQRSHYL